MSDKIGKAAKLRRLPQHARIQKRALMHPPIPSPYAGRDLQKVVYISSNTPFVSAVKRIRKLLDAIDKRDMGKIDLLSKEKDKVKIAQMGNKGKGEPEPVILKATAKAIDRALNLALFFQGQEDCRVHIKTGSLSVVDDIIEDQEQPETDMPVNGEVQSQNWTAMGEEGNRSKKRKRPDSHNEGSSNTEQSKEKDHQGLQQHSLQSAIDGVDEEDEELPETQIRRTSVIEVYISLR